MLFTQLLCPVYGEPEEEVRVEEILSIFEMPLEELMNINVSLVSRSDMRIFDAPVAVYVITEEEIAQSGLTTIPDILRLAPGMHVSQIDGNKWDISSRGFNERFNRFQLTLIDGRSLYSPLFSGVTWAYQDTYIPDIDHIEVTRGPGSSLWGADAVNGIVSIESKSAFDTLGTNITGVGGNIEQAIGVRHGFSLDEDQAMRVYAMYRNFTSQKPFSQVGFDNEDESNKVQLGFRSDWEMPNESQFTLQGDFFNMTVSDSFFTPDNTSLIGIQNNIVDAQFRGGNLLARWFTPRSEDNQITATAYIDLLFADNLDGFVYDQYVANFDIQQNLKLGEHHEWVWGVDIRLFTDDITSSPKLSFDEEQRVANTYSIFAQDTISMFDDFMRFTVGMAIQHNDYTGFEYQPNARLMFNINDNNRLWFAASRATRTPSRINHDVQFTNASAGGSNVFVTRGRTDYESETFDAFEMGYRYTPTEDILFDVSTYYNLYRKGNHIGTTADPLVTEFRNFNELDIVGVEWLIKWFPHENWNVTLSHTYQYMDQVTGGAFEKESLVNHLASVRSHWEINEDWEQFIGLYWTDSRDRTQFNQVTIIDDYLRLDAGITYHINDAVSVGVWGQNLLDSQHPEDAADGYITISNSEIRRNVFLKFTANF